MSAGHSLAIYRPNCYPLGSLAQPHSYQFHSLHTVLLALLEQKACGLRAAWPPWCSLGVYAILHQVSLPMPVSLLRFVHFPVAT